ncbi:MAG: CRTAC1 family protein [Pirellula sp.]|nr:CRTAC1 family protein [Pirellula sp.]
MATQSLTCVRIQLLKALRLIVLKAPMLMASGFCLVLCGFQEASHPNSPEEGRILFANKLDSSRISFEHFAGRTGKHFIIETIASGFATFDYDQDGWIDIYFLNGSPLEGFEYAPEIAASLQRDTPSNHLYRNTGDWQFVDVTESSGLGDLAHSVGVTVSDLNNDGFPDVFVCNHGSNELFLNQGDGTFDRKVFKSSIKEIRTAGGACFFDFNNDSTVDLFVANYLEFDINKKIVRTIFGVQASAGPLDYAPDDDSLFLNRGDGSFSEISESSGIVGEPKTGMATLAFDFDENGFQDLFVCNDTMPNKLYLNQGKGRFSEEALLSGVALNYAGATMASMGTDCADYNNDGKLDLVISNYENEVPTLYKGLGNGLFDDVAVMSGLGTANRSVKWGISFSDFDNDSFLDLYIANGHVIDTVSSLNDTSHFAAKNLLFQGTAKGKFVDVTESSGSGLQEIKVSRGVCVDDLDNDGLLDVVVLNSNSQPSLLRNESQNQNHWIQIRPIGTSSNRDGVGAFVKVRFGTAMRVAGVFSSRGYQSYYGRNIHIGLGNYQGPVDVEIVWPSGESKVYHNLKIDELHTLYE